MNHSESKNGVEKFQPDYLRNMHFKTVKVDKENLYNKVIYRVLHDDPVKKNVSVIWKAATVAATIALLIVSSCFLFFMNKKGEPIVSYIEIASIKGSKTKVLLPDSSIVWLNGASVVRYPQQFKEEDRTVEFQGEALFEVREDQKPFIVNAGDIKIKVLGTVFNVLADPDLFIVETTLLEGSVELSPLTGTTAFCRLLPNQQAIYKKDQKTISVVDVNAEAYSSWVTGYFNFNNCTLQEIVLRLERAFDTKIEVQKKSLLSKHFTAQFKPHETLEDILSILQIPERYKFKKEEGVFYIY